MSFAEEFLKLCQKYDDYFEDFYTHNRNVNFAFGRKINEDTSGAVHYYLKEVDYDENVSPIIIVNGEEYDCENYDYNTPCVDILDITLNINKAFEKWFIDLYKLEPSGIYNTSFSEISEYPLTALLGSFYNSCIEAILFEANKEYLKLKRKYLDQKYYPTLCLLANNTTFYESSKCW